MNVVLCLNYQYLYVVYTLYIYDSMAEYHVMYIQTIRTVRLMNDILYIYHIQYFRYVIIRYALLCMYSASILVHAVYV